MLILIFGSRVRRKSDSESIRDFHTQEDRVSTSFLNQINFFYIIFFLPELKTLVLDTLNPIVLAVYPLWTFLNFAFPSFEYPYQTPLRVLSLNGAQKVVISRLLIFYTSMDIN